MPSAASSAAPRAMSAGRSPTTTVCAMVDAELAQPLGEPRPVAVERRGPSGPRCPVTTMPARAAAHAYRRSGAARRRARVRPPLPRDRVADRAARRRDRAQRRPLIRSRDVAVAERHAEARRAVTSRVRGAGLQRRAGDELPAARVDQADARRGPRRATCSRAIRAAAARAAPAPALVRPSWRSVARAAVVVVVVERGRRRAAPSSLPPRPSSPARRRAPGRRGRRRASAAAPRRAAARRRAPVAPPRRRRSAAARCSESRSWRSLYSSTSSRASRPERVARRCAGSS